MLLWIAGSCTLSLDDELADTADSQSSDCETATFWFDGDGDGFGSAAGTVDACESPSGYADNPDDCDDEAPGVNPDATEVCDGLDNDCDGTVESALDAPIWYADFDLDGFGNDAAVIAACSAPEGYVATGGDCDDGDGGISPDGVETCDDGTDQDCDGADLACAASDYTTHWGSEMIAISAGSFTMGGGLGDPYDTYTDHVVTLTHDFWIGATEITRGQWESYSANATWTYDSMPTYPCTTSTSTDDCRADTISWYDVAKYCNALSAQEGLPACYLADGTDLAAPFLTDPYACPGYRMPTEAEWEYAARAGQDTEFSGSNTVGAVAWYYDNARVRGTYAHQVATREPNVWGLYDMSGNIREWTNDWYDAAYGGYGSGAAQTNPPGPTSGSYRSHRGGHWPSDESDARVAYRRAIYPEYASGFDGARLARSNP